MHVHCLSVGDKIKFAEHKQRFIVRAVSKNGRWAACTELTDSPDEELYTVVDLEDEVRGVDNYGGLGYETAVDCEIACAMFESGEAEHSHRHPPIPLVIDDVAPVTA
jgi:hypothetical protein